MGPIFMALHSRTISWLLGLVHTLHCPCFARDGERTSPRRRHAVSWKIACACYSIATRVHLRTLQSARWTQRAAPSRSRSCSTRSGSTLHLLLATLGAMAHGSLTFVVSARSAGLRLQEPRC